MTRWTRPLLVTLVTLAACACDSAPAHRSSDRPAAPTTPSTELATPTPSPAPESQPATPTPASQPVRPAPAPTPASPRAPLVVEAPETKAPTPRPKRPAPPKRATPCPVCAFGCPGGIPSRKVGPDGCPVCRCEELRPTIEAPASNP